MSSEFLKVAGLHGLHDVRFDAVHSHSERSSPWGTLQCATDLPWTSGWAVLYKREAHDLLQEGVEDQIIVRFYFCPQGDVNSAAEFRRQAQLLVIDTIPPPGSPQQVREQASSAGSAGSGTSTPIEIPYRHFRPPAAALKYWEDDYGLCLVMKEVKGEETPLLHIWPKLLGMDVVQTAEGEHASEPIASTSSSALSETPNAPVAVDWSSICDILLQVTHCLQALSERRLALVWAHPSCFIVKNDQVYIGDLHRVTANIQFSPEESLGTSEFYGSTLFKTDHRFTQSELTGRFVCGHLRYLSPETAVTRQVQPMNDLYGWGVLAYELLTGRLIAGDDDNTFGRDVDLLEGVHKHITSEVPSPFSTMHDQLKQGMTEPLLKLSEIVMLALSKNAEERYHSFDALAYDLRRLSQICRSKGDTSKFFVGEVDRISRFKFPSFVIERSSELEKLDSALTGIKSKRSATPTTRVLNVWGPSGVGKTRLVEEWTRQTEASENEGPVVVARCKTDQFSANPLTSFGQIFQSLLDRMLTRRDENPSDWRQRIKSTLGSQYSVLLALLSLDSRRLLQEENVIEASVGDVVQSENSVAAFKYWAKRFMQLFATKERPLIVLVDDAQWMKGEEKELWRHFLDSDSPLEYVLVISMTRIDDDSEMPSPSTSISATSLPFGVRNLTDEGVRHYVSACFSNRLDSASQAVPSLLFSQTRGNPFYLQTLLAQFVKDEIVMFNYGSLEWRFDVRELHGRLRAEEVDHFLDRMMSELPSELQRMLKALSCFEIAVGFPIESMASLLDKKASDLIPLIDIATRFGIVNIVTKSGAKVVKFTHDRQQGAAARLISKDEIAALHQKVSFFLRRPDLINEYMFDACEHALSARALGAPKEDEEQLVSLVMESAKRAALRASFPTATKWLYVSEEIMQETGGIDVWMKQHRKVILGYMDVGVEIACVAKEFDWALTWLEKITRHCVTVVEKLRVVCLTIRLLIAANRPNDAAERAFQTLRELGYDLEGPKKIALWNPKTPQEVEEVQEALLTQELLPEDDELHLLMALCSAAGPAVYFIRSPLMLPLFTLGLSLVKAANRPSVACGYLIGAYAVSFARFLNNMHVNRALYELTVQLCKRLPITQWTGQALCVCLAVGWCFHPLHEIESHFAGIFEQIISLGDGDFGSYTLMIELPCWAISRKPCDLNLLNKRYKLIRPFFSLSNRLLVHPTLQYLEDRSQYKPYEEFMDGVFTKRKEMESNPQLGYHNGLFHMYELRLLVWYDAPIQYQLDKVAGGMQWDDGVGGFPPSFELAFLRSIVHIRGNVESTLVEQTCAMFDRCTEWSSSWTMRIEFLRALQRLYADPMKSLTSVEETANMLQTSKEHELCGLLNYFIADQLRRACDSEVVSIGHLQRAFLQYEESQCYGYLDMLKRRFSALVYPPMPEAPEPPPSVLGLEPRPVPRKAAPPLMHVPKSNSPSGPAVDNKTEIEGSSSSDDSSMDSLTLLKSSVTLAEAKDPEILLCKLLQILCQNVRCDFAAIGLCENKNQSSIKLLAAGLFQRISLYNLNLTDESASKFCPSSIMLHVHRTGVPLTTVAKLEEIRPDPFYQDGPPRTVICLPIHNQGEQAGVILLSSRTVASDTAQSDSSKEVIGIISTLATFACVTYSHHQFSSQMTKTVEERTRELRSALQTKAMFLSQCSHELRSPLAAMMGLATVLEASPGLSTVQREHLRTISSSGEDLLALISNILDHAKLESRSVIVEELPMRLEEVVETALDTIAPTAQAKGIEVALITPFQSSPPGLLGDPFRTKQVLLNLLSNAVKFTPPPSTVKQNQTVVVSWSWKMMDGKISVSIDVTDTGVGIPNSKVDKLFKSFSQVDESITRSYGGSGLGLVISRDLANLLGGDCTVNSEYGKGSTFTFTFVAPADPKSSRREIVEFATPHSTLVFSSRSHAWVGKLVKDIGLFNCAPVLVSDNIEQVTGHVSVSAEGISNGMNGHHFDLIILDISIVTDGSLAQIRRAHPRAKIVFISRAVDLTDDMARLQISRHSIVARPIKFEELYQAVRPKSPSPQPSSRPQISDKPLKKTFDKKMGKHKPLRILIVDDSSVNVEVCKRLLELYGYTDVEAVSDGLQAVEAADRTQFDLILLDLQMPVMDGYDAFERIKGSPLAGDPSCVSLSANADKKALQKCEAVGFFDICTKPIRMERLKAILNKVYDHRVQMQSSRVQWDQGVSDSRPRLPPTTSEDDTAMSDQKRVREEEDNDARSGGGDGEGRKKPRMSGGDVEMTD